MSLSRLKDNFYTNLAKQKSSNNCTCTGSYSNYYNCNNLLGIVTMFLPLLISTGTAVGGLENAISSRRAAKNGDGGSVDMSKSIFSYGTDNTKDYASETVKEIRLQLDENKKEIDARNKELSTFNASSVRGSIQDYETEVTNAETAYTSVGSTITTLETEIAGLNTQIKSASKTSNTTKSELETQLANKKKELEKKQVDKAEKWQAVETAKQNLAEATARKNTLETEIKELLANKAKLIEQLTEYGEYDSGNGIAAERATSEEAIKGIGDKTFTLSNARQLLNEYSSAKRAFEQLKNPTEEDKNKLRAVAKNFMDEYEEEEKDGATKQTLKGSYNLVKSYIDNL